MINIKYLKRNSILYIFILTVSFSLLCCNQCQSPPDSTDIKSLGYYNNELKEGIWIYYYDNDTIAEIGSYKDGEKQGLWRGWFRNGVQSYVGQYFNGKMDSIWCFYYKNGCIRSKGKFKGNFKIGKWVDYHIDGDSTIRWENGTIQSFVPIDMKYPMQIENSKMTCRKKGVSFFLNLDSLERTLGKR